jgi:hypothetical protein
VIAGVRVVAADASARDGKSSIGMVLSTGARASVRESVILAGDGKDGEPGEDADTERAPDGLVGNDGVDACTTDAAVGALPVANMCDDGIESTGGYGGDGGKGGGYGGASIAIVALEDTKLELAATLVVAGNGGRGGVGGTGQLGGMGQPGGQGGLGYGTTGMWKACDGGDGGTGGRGGDAGGGLGGASVGIAYVVPNLALLPGTTIEIGNAGEGGPAGNASLDDEVGKGRFGPLGPIYRFGAANELPR